MAVQRGNALDKTFDITFNYYQIIEICYSLIHVNDEKMLF